MQVGWSIKKIENDLVKNTQNIYLVILLFITITCTYGMKTNLFYLNWLAGFFAAFVIFSHILLNGTTIHKSILYSLLLLSAWQLWCLAMTFYATDVYRHLQYMGVSIFYLVVSVFLAKIIFKEKHVADKIFLWSCTVWVSLNLAIWVLSYFIILDSKVDFSGIVHNRNTFAIITSLLIGYLIFFHANYSKPVRRLIVILFAVSVFLIAASASVKGIIGFSIILMAVNYEKLNKRHVFNLFLVALFILLLLFFDNRVFSRVERFAMVFTEVDSLRTSESAYLRWHYIKQGAAVFKEHPLTGVGVSNSRYYLLLPHRPGRDIGTYAHNNYVEMLLNGGLPAFLLYYIPIVFLLIYHFKKRSQSRLNLYLFAMLIFKLALDVAWVSYYDWMGLFFVSAATVKYYEEIGENRKRDKKCNQGEVYDKNSLCGFNTSESGTN